MYVYILAYNILCITDNLATKNKLEINNTMIIAYIEYKGLYMYQQLYNVSSMYVCIYTRINRDIHYLFIIFYIITTRTYVHMFRRLFPEITN